MLVTRQCEIGRNTWPSSKLEAIYKDVASPRMSNFEALSTQPDWREQYSPYPLSGENGILQPSFEHPASSDVSNNDQSQQQGSVRSHLKPQHSVDTIQQGSQPSALSEQLEDAPVDSGNQIGNSIHNDSLVSTESRSLSLDTLGASQLNPVSNAPPQQALLANDGGEGGHLELKEEDDELDDDEMLDAEDGGAVPLTAAERRAERRKMKRFRLTHQQTRFLMSEFAKQAHPDAGHRERLSQEIPGLSPRQVQVWFQNRRAKIKRLTADDRDRMMKMRAVPDDFDNVQALHSPYGAVQGINTPMQSPIDFTPHYADHLIRPLIVDTMRRTENDEHMSPTGLSLAFGQVGFHSGGGLGSPDALSPVSLNSADRYYSSHLSSPISAGSRGTSLFDRQNSVTGLSHAGQQTRSLQPLQLRETMSRSRSDSLQSPLRSSMSWKGETIDYNNYQAGQQSPQLGGRQQSVYRPDQTSGASNNINQYDGNTYSGTGIQGSASMTSSSTHNPSASIQQSPPSVMSRIRSSSSAFPSSANLGNQYRALPPQNNTLAPPTPRHNSFSSTFSTGYASAPLAAPVDFSLPRTPGESGQTRRDFSIPQLSAPMAPPPDFNSAYSSNLSPTRTQHGDRDFSNQGSNTGALTNLGQVQRADQHKLPATNHEEASYMRPSEYNSGQTRKRSFTMPGAFGAT